jgi:ribosome biogenesis GTPase
MFEDSFDRLRPIGFNQAVAQALAALDATSLQGATPVRVVEVQRDSALVHDGALERRARIHPRLARELAEAGGALAVGDWVLAQADGCGEPWIHARAAPATQLVRRDPGGVRHVVVSNVDTAFLLMGLDGDFNARRLERYLAVVLSGGVWPVVVLTKADVAADAGAALAALRARLPPTVPLHAVNALDPGCTAELAPYLGAGQTIVLLGSSGAGKSTLTNTLVGSPVQATRAVRANDHRGRHTTTARTLRLAAGAACLIDTPGLRGLRPNADEDALDASFSDIAALAARCRFRDCRHRDEPDCAVRAGVPPDRLANYHKLARELRRDSLTVLERKQQVARWKVLQRAAHARIKMKR